MDSRYLESCHLGTPFYNPFASYTSTIGEPVQAARRPGLWTSSREGVWEVWTPLGASLRLQGWKIHVGAIASDAASTLSIVTSYCVENRIPFKFLRTRELLAESNSKSASRSSSGKFITIYPPNDVAFETTAVDLGRALSGRPSPYILSDYRHGQGPVYFRYGAFLGLSAVDERDDQVASRVDPNMHLVPDSRVPAPVRPEGVAIPDVVRVAIEAYEADVPESPLNDYRDILSLQHSNGGGVYRAVRGHDGMKVVLKEARPYAGLDFRGRDATERLRIEHDNLVALAGSGIAPRAHRRFTAWEHEFLEMEFVEGVPLNSWIAMNYPFRADVSGDEISAYTEVALEILASLVRAVEVIHAEGRVLGDLHPANVIVSEMHAVRIIDHEDGRRPGDDEPPSFNAIGFRAPEGTSPAEADWFAASRIAMMLFQVQSAMEILAPDYWQRMVTIVSRDFGGRAARAVSEVNGRFTVRENALVQLRPGVPVSTWLPLDSAGVADQDELVNEVTRGIAATVEEDLSRRRYPGDIAQSAPLGTLNVRSGAAGVLMALHRSGGTVDVADRDWLALRTAHSLDVDALGLFNGLAGIACVLHELGCDDITARAVHAIRGKYRRMKRLDLHSGLAGIGLSMLSLAQTGSHASTEDIVVDIAETLASRVVQLDPSNTGLSTEPGLFFGWSGVAVFFASLARWRPEFSHYSQLAHRCLENDLSFTSTYGQGIVGLQDQTVNRSLPYLARGSAGVLFASTYVPSATDAHTEAGLLASCNSRYYAMSGLYNGTAGILAALASVQDIHDVTQQRDRLVRNIWDYALRWNDTLQFAGESYLRLSSDLSTGSAGILAALTSMASGQPAWLPVVQRWHPSSSSQPTPGALLTR